MKQFLVSALHRIGKAIYDFTLGAARLPPEEPVRVHVRPPAMRGRRG
jgi:hypothetical protein